MHVQLPTARGTLAPYELRPAPVATVPAPRFSRLAYAAAHVVARHAAGTRDLVPSDPEAIDWEATLAFRRHLWAHGFGIAEAMDTAQRERLGWASSARLLEQTLRAAREGDEAHPRRVIGGAGTDSLAGSAPTLAQIVDAYVMQAEFIHERGGRVILFPTVHLPARFPEPHHYVEVYRAVSAQVSRPVFVHWLGEMFAPALRGYFPGESFRQIMDDNPQVLGVKVSLLDQAREEAIRRRLAGNGQVVLTGDDFNYPTLIRGSDAPPADARTFSYEGGVWPLGDYSHALLGIFDGIAPVASRALTLLAAGDAAGYERLLAPTVPLARAIFGAPTEHYKAGLVFLAYLNGHQPHFHLLDDLEQRRDMAHYGELFRLADAAGVLADPPRAYERFKPLLEAAGYRAA